MLGNFSDIPHPMEGMPAWTETARVDLARLFLCQQGLDDSQDQCLPGLRP